MGSKLRIEPKAVVEIENAIEWYESKQIGLGLDFYNYLSGYFETLKQGYSLFEIKRKPSFRELPLKRFPFIIIYEVFDNEIIIYSVFNTFQNPIKKK